MTQSAHSKEQALRMCTRDGACPLSDHLCPHLSSQFGGVIFEYKARDMDKVCANTFLPKPSTNKINGSGLKCLNIFICLNKRPVQLQLKNTFITRCERWGHLKKLFGLCEEKKEIKYTEHYLNNIKAKIQGNKRQEIQS